jgi:GNAT superfamily N-acetyltransferase
VESLVFIATTDAEIESCFDAFSALRSHIDRISFVPQVRRQEAQGYQILAVRCGAEVPSAAGFRFAEFLAWGKVLYIDDLTTLPDSRGCGHADVLMNWMIEHARRSGCRAVHLDTGYTRQAAHRLYLRKGLHFDCHHLALQLDGAP